MTIIEKLIDWQFRFELGMAKVGFYVTLVNLMLVLTTLLTVKGISFPVWATIPLAVVLVVSLVILGYYLETYDVVARLNSRMNTRGNPEFSTMIVTIDRLEKKIDALEERLTRNEFL